jgi:hypothetical protein
MHGIDVGGWKRMGGRPGKPQELGDLPWFVDVSTFTESHFLMFDVEKLKLITTDYLDVAKRMNLYSFPSETHLIGKIANKNGLTILRDNEVFYHCDFVHHREDMDTYPKYVDLDLMRINNWDLVARIRNPKASFDVWHYWYRNNGLRTGLIWGVGLLGLQYSPAWIPDIVFHRPVTDPLVFKFTKSLFSFLGYEVTKQDDGHIYFDMVAAYPSNLFVNITVDPDFKFDPKLGQEFLRIKTPTQTLRFISWGMVTMHDMRAMMPKDRGFSIPKSGKISFATNPVHMKFPLAGTGAPADWYFNEVEFDSQYEECLVAEHCDIQTWE